MTVVGLLVTSLMSVSAAEIDGEFVTNMDGDTYRTTRIAQVQEALTDGKITQEQADELLLHIEDVVAGETFGNGPTNGLKGDGNVTCVLGEDSNLGIFRSESAGMKTGSGNGNGRNLADGSGSGNGNKGNNSGGKGAGNGSQGTGIGHSDECELVSE